jgi:translation initiation factor 4A
MSLENEEINNWECLDLNTNLLRGIYSYGFEKPSPIQQKAIKPILDGNDVIAQSQSGTGKTGCFVIASLQNIDIALQETQIIIMAPTRELSIQIKNVISEISNYMKELKIYLLIGGQSTDTDISNFRYERPHIIVGCPGRIHEMIRRKCLDTKHIKLIILDEADEMLSQGFKEQVYNIFQFLSNNIQVALFSATLPVQLYNLTDKFMRDPIKIIVKTEMLTLEGIKQYYVNVEDDSQKYETLKDLFSVFSVSQSIIYCNSIKRVQDLYNAMIHDGYSVCQIHSGLDKQERINQYKEFKDGSKRVLLSSNVTARGIDIQQVSTVINFDIPKCSNTYLHRIGRSGRYGRKGTAINFITKRDIRLLKEIEEFYSTQIGELPSDFK